MPSLLLGTAGHIDHGKTALIRALTGVDCDRLPEEKERNITIDIGFAALELGEFQLGIVDVPGHERFIKNMLAGATGIDLALLVVAVDDAVKPQTREHLEILEHLRIPAGVIALTKCDLAEDDWIDLVETEVRELTDGGILADAPAVRVSAVAGTGLEELRGALADAARKAAAARRHRERLPFRMAIDRTFSAPGHGTVVTGSIASGCVKTGDRLQLQPSGAEVRVRGLQNHDLACDELSAGQRAALNLAGVRFDEVGRGDSLAPPGMLHSSRTMTAQITLNPSAPRPLRSRARVRFHVGAGEVQAAVRLAGAPELNAGDTGYVQLILSEEVAVTWGEACILRAVSPMALLGGGRVIDPWAVRIKHISAETLAHLDALASGTDAERIAAAAFLHRETDWSADDMFVLAGVSDAATLLAQLERDGTMIRTTSTSGDVRWLHRDALADWRQRLIDHLSSEHRRTPLEPLVELSRLSRYFRRLSPALFESVLVAAEADGTIRRNASGAALADWSPQLDAQQQALLTQLVARIESGGPQPPTIGQLSDELKRSANELSPLLALLVARALLVRVSSDVYLHAQALDAAKKKLADALRDGRELTVSEIRDLLGTNRKVAVPLCEYFDSMGFTRRQGDVRRLAQPASQTPAAL